MLIEARRTWGRDLLAVAHVPARGVVRLADFGLPGSSDSTIVFDHGRLACDAIDLGDSTLWFELVERAPLLERGKLGEFRTTKTVMVAAVVHAALLAIAFIGRAAPYEDDAAHFETMKALSAAIDAKDEIPVEPTPVSQESGSAKPGESGLAGSPMATKTSGLTARSKGAENLEAKRQLEIQEAREFGMIGLLRSSEALRGGGWNSFAPYEGPSAVGNIFGTQVVDSFGFGGAGLSGTGLGGGGLGGGVEIDGAGGQGVGSCHCGLGSTHITRGPSFHPGQTQVNGRLPPEAIQRIVRQNFGRMRGCYEASLVRNPSLEGRLSVKFVIDRSGAVSMVNATESSFVDSGVTSCVERAFSSMSFPEPQGGIVTVVYPLVLST